MSLITDFGLTNLDEATAYELVAARLRKELLENPLERARQAEMRMRKLLFKDGGDTEIERVIDALFADAETRDLRKAVARRCRFDNVTKRTIDELSTVYAEDPRRRVADEQHQLRYQELQKRIRQDEVMRRANAYLNLCNDILICFRVRQLGNRPPEPVLEVVTPDQFWAIPHPEDKTFCIGYVIALEQKLEDRVPNVQQNSLRPGFLVVTDDERFTMTVAGRIIGESMRPMPFDRMPYIFMHKSPPDGSLFDSMSGRDIRDADLMSWLENTLMIKESKSISKQNVWSGDMAAMASGQSQETEVDLIAPEGMSFQQVDRGVQLAQFREASDHIGDRAMANHGIPPSVRRHQGANSGYEQELRERRLRELRRAQRLLFHNTERDLVGIQVMVLDEAAPDQSFADEGWSIEFPEIQAPLSQREDLEVFERRRQLGLTSTIEYMRQKDPDLLTDQAAEDRLSKHVEDELVRNSLMRPLAAMNGSMGQTLDEARTPEENGALGQQAAKAAETVQ